MTKEQAIEKIKTMYLSGEDKKTIYKEIKSKGFTLSFVKYHLRKNMKESDLNSIDSRLVCPKCKKYKGSRQKSCQSCKNDLIREKWKTVKIGDKIYNKHKYAKYAYIRYTAKAWLSGKRPEICQHCGYSKHVEVCHIKPIASFSADTTLDIVNHESNLLLLCPNCHWEFDNCKTN